MERPKDMRSRAAALAAVVAFAVAVTGIAAVAARSGGGSGLQRLPFAAGGAERADAAAMSLGTSGVGDIVVEGTLPTLADEAPAFRLAAGDRRAAADRLARALGVDPAKVTVESAPGLPWYVSAPSPAGSVPTCTVTPLGSGRPEPETGSCVSGSPGPARDEAWARDGRPIRDPATVQACPPCPPDADCTYCVPTPVTTVPPPPPADLPSQADAERIARDIFGRLGLGTDGLQLLGGTSTWDAVVSPSVAGLPTRGLETGLSIGPKGEVVGGHGYLGKAERIGDYPLVGVQAGLDRLRKGAGIGPQPLQDRAPVPGHHLRAAATTVTGARIALLHVGDVLAPVYEFATKGGGALTVPAVTDRWLQEQVPHRADDLPHAPPGASASCGASVAGVGVDPGGEAERNQPLVVEVCVEPLKAKVGQGVVFRVTATDGDARIITEGCGAPTATFGDEEGAVTGQCMAACAAPSRFGSKPQPEAGKHQATYRHAYAEPGTYTARFSFQSTMCSPYESRGEGEATVVVE